MTKEVDKPEGGKSKHRMDKRPRRASGGRTCDAGAEGRDDARFSMFQREKVCFGHVAAIAQGESRVAYRAMPYEAEFTRRYGQSLAANQ